MLVAVAEADDSAEEAEPAAEADNSHKHASVPVIRIPVTALAPEPELMRRARRYQTAAPAASCDDSCESH